MKVLIGAVFGSFLMAASVSATEVPRAPAPEFAPRLSRIRAMVIRPLTIGLESGRAAVIVPVPAAAVPARTRDSSLPRVLSDGNFTRGVAEHPDASRIRETLADPRFRQIDASLVKSFESSGRRLLDRQVALISEARELDARDDVLILEWKDLQEGLDALRKEAAEIEAQISANNARCNPPPDESTYQDCVLKAEQLNRWADEHDARAAAFDLRMTKYQVKYDSLVAAIEVLNRGVSAWESEIEEFCARVATAVSVIPLPGRCVLKEIARTPPPESKPYNCHAWCNRSGSFVPWDFRPSRGPKPCYVDVGQDFPDPGAR